MIFTSTKLAGAFIIDLEEKPDSRGFFARTFCADEFLAHGLKPTVAQCNLSFNHKKGTLRGMHYQTLPAAETKLIRCTQGAIYDVIVDMRPESPTYLSHIGVELSAENRRALYVPEMFAHGYQALTDGAEVVYQVGEFSENTALDPNKGVQNVLFLKLLKATTQRTDLPIWNLMMKNVYS
ncbi:MAG: dTDP-4-dehydrorhamnose 3,5-epimerase family protein, partial [Aphanizomenon sp.]